MYYISAKHNCRDSILLKAPILLKITDLVSFNNKIDESECINRKAKEINSISSHEVEVKFYCLRAPDNQGWSFR